MTRAGLLPEPKERRRRCARARRLYGDIWTWTALYADTKLVPSSAVGRWDGFTAQAFEEGGQPQGDGRSALHALQLRPHSPDASVTTVLDIIAKPALGPWYAKKERRHFEAAMLEVLSKPGARDPEYVLSAVAEAVRGAKAAEREKQKAAAIGTAVHAGIEWQLRRMVGEDAGPEPLLPEAAVWAIESWKDWAKSVHLEPVAIERTVYCADCGYAGTLDLYARVNGVRTIIDWKSGKAIYPEAFLQNIAYRHAAAELGMPSDQGLIVRLPTKIDNPAGEVMAVPETLTLEDFLAALRLWRWQRRMDGRLVEVPVA